MNDDGTARRQLAQTRIDDRTLSHVVRAVVDLAQELLENCDGAGLEVLDPHGTSTSVSTDARSLSLDELQHRLHDGPFFESQHTGLPHSFGPGTPVDRWRTFRVAARAQGLTACLALPLVVDGELVGVLNLYAWPTSDFAGWDHAACDSFAAGASVVVLNARAYERNRERLAILSDQVAADDDDVAKAHGILMERHQESLTSATARLTTMASKHGTTLETAAQRVVASLQ